MTMWDRYSSQKSLYNLRTYGSLCYVRMCFKRHWGPCIFAHVKMCNMLHVRKILEKSYPFHCLRSSCFSIVLRDLSSPVEANFSALVGAICDITKCKYLCRDRPDRMMRLLCSFTLFYVV